MKNVQLKFVGEVDAHNRAEITTIIQNPYQNNQIISIGHDFFIRVWNKLDLTLVRSTRILSPYLMCIVPYKGKFLMGIGNGNIMVLDQNLEIEKQYPDHEDCMTSILIHDNRIITTSYDGSINFLNKETFTIQKSLQMGFPILQCICFENNLYIAARPSLKINLKTLQSTQIGDYTHFVVHKNSLFGCSDEKGVTCLNDNIALHIPCHYMISTGQFILFSTEQGIGILDYDPESEGNWKIITFTELQPGCSILSGIFIENYCYFVGESGNIYKFKVTYDEKEVIKNIEKNQKVIEEIVY